MPQSPYKGLVPFEEGDAPFFHGRETERDVVITNLMASRLTLLYGASGVGKTSLLQAGVVARLRDNARVNFAQYGEPEFGVGVLTSWVNDPVRLLVDCAAEAVQTAKGRAPDISTLPTNDLVNALRALTQEIHGEIFLILDQFEEFFVYHGPEASSCEFDRQLSAALNQTDLCVNFLISIREESLAWLDRFKRSIPGLFDNYLRIRHLDQRAARAAICGPIASYNRERKPGDALAGIDDALLEELLQTLKFSRDNVLLGGMSGFRFRDHGDQEVDDDCYQASALQLVMDRLWREERERSSSNLQVDTLRRLGGVTSIVRTHLDESMLWLDEGDRAVAAEVLRFLVTPTGAKTALAVEDLVEYTHAAESQVLSVLKALSCRGGPQLLRRFVASPSRSSGVRYEIFHDLLVPAILDWRNRYLRAVQEKELLAAQARAERERRLREIGLIQVLTARAPREHVLSCDERGLLLARQAYLLAEREGGPFLDQVDLALRTLLSMPSYGPILEGHEHEVAKLVYSPDGQSLASAAYDRTIRIWNVKEPYEMREVLGGHEDGVVSLAYSADGRLLASGGFDRTVRIWDCAAGWRQIVTLTGHRNTVAAVVFSPVRRLIASGSWDGTVRLWDLDKEETDPVVLPHDDWVWAVAFSPNGQTLASGDRRGRVHLWSVVRGEPPRGRIIAENLGEVFSLAFSSDGSILASGSGDGVVRLWQVPGGTNPFVTLTGHSRNVRCVAIRPDGRVLASGDDQTVRLWDLQNLNLPPTVLHGHSMGISSVAFSPGGEQLASSSWDRKIRLWPLAAPLAAPTILRHGGIVRSVAFSKDGQRLLSGGDDRNVCMWNLADPEPVALMYEGHEGQVASVAFSPLAEFFASGSHDNTIRLWQWSESRVQATVFRGHHGIVSSIAFSPDGQTLVSGGDDHSVRVWKVGGNGIGDRVLWGHKEAVTSVAVSPDGRWLASGGHDRAVLIRDLNDLDSPPICYSGHSKGVACVAFSPDSCVLASGSYDRTVQLWEVGNPAAVPVILRGHNLGVHSLSFSSYSGLLASGSNDWSVRLWSLRNLAYDPIVLRSREGGVSSVAFDPTGERVALGSYWGTIAVEIARTSRLAEMVCRIARRNLTADEWRQFLGEDIPYERTCPGLDHG